MPRVDPGCAELAQWRCALGCCKHAVEDERTPCCLCGKVQFGTDEARTARREIALVASALMGFSL